MRKLFLNFGPAARRTVDFGTYLSMLATFVSVLPTVMKTRDLKLFDKKFGQKRGRVSFKVIGDKPFVIDCREVDRMIVEESFAFGLAREIYFRRCYLHGHPDIKPEDVKTVVDLGANRGIFSTMCTPCAQTIALVEPLEKYNASIAKCMSDNGFTNYKIFNCFVGSNAIAGDSETPVISFEDVLKQSDIDHVDLLKIDIEGGEFQMFADNIPLDKITRISMEVHAPKGDPRPIAQKLTDAGFTVLMTDSLFQPVEDARESEFLYAYNPKNRRPA